MDTAVRTIAVVTATAAIPACVFHWCHRILRARNASAPSRRHTTAVRKGSFLVRLPFLLVLRLQMEWIAHRCTCARTLIVYDVSNRETFEALPRWLEELDTYVPPEVVKIVVGNKLDKVRAVRLPQTLTHIPSPSRTHVGILPAGADDRGRGVCPAHGVPVRRGVRKDGRGRG